MCEREGGENEGRGGRKKYTVVSNFFCVCLDAFRVLYLAQDVYGTIFI